LPPEIKGDDITTEEFVDFLFLSNGNSRGYAGLKDRIHKWTQKQGISVVREARQGRQIDRWYSRNDVEKVIRNLMYQPEHPLDFEFNDGNKKHTIKLDELLLVVPSSALNLANASRLLPAVQPLSGDDMLPFLGRFKHRVSIFNKYKLTESDGTDIRLRTHAPRHNINTFLALSGISEHQQAMAMGRVSIEQNAAYQHMTTVEKQKVERNSIEYDESKAIAIKPTDFTPSIQKHISTPVEIVKKQGKMLVNPSLDLESNLQNSFHALDDKEMTENLIEKLLNDDILLGEMQEAWNSSDLRNANKETKKQFVETHGFMHVTVNGACTENIATSGCAHRLRCVSGSGCVHLHVTGRSGELENIAFTYKKKTENLAKFQAEYSDDPAYKDAISHMKNQVKNLKTLYEKSKKLQSNKIALQVFNNGDSLGSSQPRRTLIDLYSEALPALLKGDN